MSEDVLAAKGEPFHICVERTGKYHYPKNLGMALAGEVGECLQNFNG